MDVAGSSPAPATKKTNAMSHKILSLSIKQAYFDEIMAGKKKKEYREILATNARKYIRYVSRGVRYENINDIPADHDDSKIILEPVKYDAIKLITGAYSGKRPWALVEVKDAEIELMTDDDGEFVTYMHNDEEYIYAQIIYTLGDVLERSNG